MSFTTIPPLFLPPSQQRTAIPPVQPPWSSFGVQQPLWNLQQSQLQQQPSATIHTSPRQQIRMIPAATSSQITGATTTTTLTQQNFVASEEESNVANVIASAPTWEEALRRMETFHRWRIEWYYAMLACISQSPFGVSTSTAQGTIVPAIAQSIRSAIPAQIIYAYITREQMLGKGSYGEVYRVYWKVAGTNLSLHSNCAAIENNELTRIPLALKTERIREELLGRGSDIEERITEQQCNQRANDLVTRAICPNFVLYLGTTFVYEDTPLLDATMVQASGAASRRRIPAIMPSSLQSSSSALTIKRTYYQYTLFEYATESVESWTKNQTRTCDELFSVYFQSVMGIYFMAREYGMVNRDLYLRNILLNRIYDVHYQYVITAPQSTIVDLRRQSSIGGVTSGRGASSDTTAAVNAYTYVLRTMGILVKLADFGLCALPTRRAVRQFERQPFTSLDQLYYDDMRMGKPGSVHVALLDLPRYARDVLALTHSMILTDAVKNCPVMLPFLRRVEGTIAQRILANRNYLQQVPDLMRLVADIFSPVFMDQELIQRVGWTEHPIVTTVIASA